MMHNKEYLIYYGRWGRAVVRSLWAMTMAWCVSGCDLEDERDRCCQWIDGVFMNYKYIYKGEDVLPTYVSDMTHHIFTEEGEFVQKIPPSQNVRSVQLELPKGDYKMIAIGNRTKGIDIQTGLREARSGEPDEMILSVMRDPDEPENYCSCGELYGGFSRFHISGERRQVFETYMSNLHCRLDIRVEWENRPPGVRDFDMFLRNVPICYYMDLETLTHSAGYDFPKNDGQVGDYHIQVPMEGQTLTAEFLTLRYADNMIPILEICHLGERITPPLDLARAFRQWGWRPDADTIQHYRIKVIIRIGGSVIIRPWIEGDVVDWIDGGTFS